MRLTFTLSADQAGTRVTKVKKQWLYFQGNLSLMNLVTSLSAFWLNKKILAQFKLINLL